MGKTYIGTVNYFHETFEKCGIRRKYVTVWNFGIVVRPTEGDAFVIPAQLKAKEIKGSISLNDELEIIGKYKKGRIFTPKRVFNRSMGLYVGKK